MKHGRSMAEACVTDAACIERFARQWSCLGVVGVKDVVLAVGSASNADDMLVAVEVLSRVSQSCAMIALVDVLARLLAGDQYKC